MRYLPTFKVSALATGALALVAAVAGLVNPGMYDPVVPVEIMAGVFAQDLVVALGALLIIGLTAGMRAPDVRRTIVVAGILGFFFYAYGIYGIEQVYTPLYVLYLAVWAASTYTLALALVGLDYAAIESRGVPRAVRVAAAAYGIVIAVMFNALWIGQLVPLIQTADRIEYLFSVYVIDLVFVMPAFVIAAVLAIRERPLGIAALPALFVVGVGILSPLAVAEALKGPRYGLPVDTGSLALFGILAAVFLISTVVYLVALGAGPDGSVATNGRRAR